MTEPNDQKRTELMESILSRPDQFQEYIQTFISIQSDEFKAKFENYTEEQTYELVAFILHDLIDVILKVKEGKAEIPSHMKVIHRNI